MKAYAFASVASCPAHLANAGTFASVPPVRRLPVSSVETGGTVYPQRSRGSKFNQLAPQVPEGLIAPCSAMTRQQRWSRAPPLPEAMASHD